MKLSFILSCDFHILNVYHVNLDFWILDNMCMVSFNSQVHQIYSRISQHNLEPNNETFRRMILQFVKMKDVSLLV